MRSCPSTWGDVQAFPLSFLQSALVGVTVLWLADAGRCSFKVWRKAHNGMFCCQCLFRCKLCGGEKLCDPCQKNKRCRCSGFGYRANLSVISGNEKNLGFVVLGEVLVVFPQRRIVVSASLQVLVQVRSFCFAVFGAHMRRMLPKVFCSGRRFQSTVDPWLLGTWPSFDEQEIHGKRVQWTLVLKMSLPVGFGQCGILVFNNSTDHCQN